MNRQVEVILGIPSKLSSSSPATIPSMEPELPPGASATKLFEDKTPNATILNRILLNSLNVAAHDDLPDADGSDLIDLIVLLSRKLLSVWTHLQAYQVHETALAEQAAAWPVTKREYSQDLYEEFDVFSVQIKSTLDHLVQVLRPILGRSKWTMYSFGDKGERVLASLQRNTSKHHAGHVRMMEHYLFGENNKGWLAMIINARDQVNHGMAGGMKIQRFAVYRDAAGTVHLPMWNPEQRLGAAMVIGWENLFRYVEDFIVLGINFRLKPEYGLVRTEMPLTSPVPSWTLTTRQAVDEFMRTHTPSKTI